MSVGHPPGASVVARGLPHPECVAVGPDGALYAGTAVGDHHLSPGPVVRVDPVDGSVTGFADTGGRVLGLACWPGGGFVCCDGLRGAVCWVDGRGRPVAELSAVDGRRLDRPNGCVVDAAGGLWFTDSGTATAGEPTGAVCHLGPDGTSRVAAAGLVFPNGIGLSPDGRELYVTLTRDDSLLALPVLGPGRLGPPRLVTDALDSGPDGLSVAADGAVYVAVTRTSRVVRVDPDGAVRVLVEDPRLLRMPSHAQVDGDRVLVPSLFGDTVAAVPLPPRHPN